MTQSKEDADKKLLDLALAFMDEIAYTSIATGSELKEIGFRWLLERYGMDRFTAHEMAMNQVIKLK